MFFLSHRTVLTFEIFSHVYIRPTLYALIYNIIYYIMYNNEGVYFILDTNSI